MKIAFRQMCVTLCGSFGPNERGVVGCVKRIWSKYTAKWGVQMVGMNFQTRSKLAGCEHNFLCSEYTLRYGGLQYVFFIRNVTKIVGLPRQVSFTISHTFVKWGIVAQDMARILDITTVSTTKARL